MKHEYENLGDHNEYNIFKVILAIIVLFSGKLIGIIYIIFAGIGIIDILLKIKNNSDIIIFILASILIINGNILNNIIFYINKINIESKIREETLIIPGVAPKIKIDNKKMV